MFSAFCIEFISFWLMILSNICRLVFFQQFIINYILFSLNFWLGFACRLYLVLKYCFRRLFLTKICNCWFEVAIGTWNICFLHIFYHLCLLSITNFALLFVHKCSSEFITTSFTYVCSKRNLMSFSWTI